MRAPDQTFNDVIDAFLRRHNLPASPKEAIFFARVRHFSGIPRARRANDYAKLVDSLNTAWEVANVWSGGVEIARRRRENAARQLDAIRVMRRTEVPFHPAVKDYLERLEQLHTAQAMELEPDEISDLEYVRRDQLTVAELGRKRRSAGQMLFVREVSLAMREIFGKPHDKVVGELAGLAFETKPLTAETVRTMCKKTGLIRPK